jgi:hypothetical protein
MFAILFYQLGNSFLHGSHQQFLRGRFFIGIYNEQVQLHIGRQGGVYGMLLQAPRLYHQAAYAVAVYRKFELLFWNGKAHPYRRNFFAASCGQAEQPYGKNRIRFPGTEKRINMLLTLEPLVCFESITNGVVILNWII